MGQPFPLILSPDRRIQPTPECTLYSFRLWGTTPSLSSLVFAINTAKQERPLFRESPNLGYIYADMISQGDPSRFSGTFFQL